MTTAAIAPQGTDSMTALVHDQYGAFDQLRVQQIAKPVPGPKEVRVQVHAAALHAGDCMCVKGSPRIVRVATGLFGPKNSVPGFDVAGVVEAVGADVKDFREGDEVFGACMGACATYACVSEDHLAHKPTNLTLKEAAAVSTSGLAALHALRDAADLQSGQRILINGAAGGVGHFAVQIAKAFGAHVTGVCSGQSVAMVRALGADEVLDYTKQDFAAGGPRFDVIFDNVENRSLSDCRAALKPNGTLIANSGTGATGLRFMTRLFKPLLLSPFVGQKLKRFVSTPNRKDLLALKELIEAGKLRPVIDRTYSLAQVPAALTLIEAGHTHGKVLIDLEVA
ncbi:MAG: NADPH:quinone reductase-like Zn-dependent oxidoreductase [Planctomycetota bacterium]|jgi:NADPH:quinone reductase-like Zn-dependent oxidoreductase